LADICGASQEKLQLSAGKESKQIRNLWFNLYANQQNKDSEA